MTKSHETEWLRRRLDLIIQLLMETAPGGAKTTSSKIERLLALGFSPAEAAQVVGKKVNYVTAVVATKKRGASRRQKKAKTEDRRDTPAAPEREA